MKLPFRTRGEAERAKAKDPFKFYSKVYVATGSKRALRKMLELQKKK